MLTWIEIQNRLQGKSKEDVVIKQSFLQSGESNTEIVEIWFKNKRIAIITPSQKEELVELGYKTEKM